MLSLRKTVLFVCVENSCRSQMAEAFGKILGQDVIESYSSGSHPSGRVNEKAIRSMRELGYDLSAHRSKQTDRLPQQRFDYVVTMGCGEACPNIQARERVDWQIPDPKHMEMKAFNVVRDTIKDKVICLIEKIKSTNAPIQIQR